MTTHKSKRLLCLFLATLTFITAIPFNIIHTSKVVIAATNPTDGLIYWVAGDSSITTREAYRLYSDRILKYTNDGETVKLYKADVLDEIKNFYVDSSGDTAKLKDPSSWNPATLTYSEVTDASAIANHKTDFVNSGKGHLTKNTSDVFKKYSAFKSTLEAAYDINGAKEIQGPQPGGGTTLPNPSTIIASNNNDDDEDDEDDGFEDPGEKRLINKILEENPSLKYFYTENGNTYTKSVQMNLTVNQFVIPLYTYYTDLLPRDGIKEKVLGDGLQTLLEDENHVRTIVATPIYKSGDTQATVSDLLEADIPKLYFKYRKYNDSYEAGSTDPDKKQYKESEYTVLGGGTEISALINRYFGLCNAIQPGLSDTFSSLSVRSLYIDMYGNICTKKEDSDLEYVIVLPALMNPTINGGKTVRTTRAYLGTYNYNLTKSTSTFNLVKTALKGSSGQVTCYPKEGVGFPNEVDKKIKKDREYEFTVFGQKFVKDNNLLSSKTKSAFYSFVVGGVTTATNWDYLAEPAALGDDFVAIITPKVEGYYWEEDDKFNFYDTVEVSDAPTNPSILDAFKNYATVDYLIPNVYALTTTLNTNTNFNPSKYPDLKICDNPNNNLNGWYNNISSDEFVFYGNFIDGICKQNDDGDENKWVNDQYYLLPKDDDEDDEKPTPRGGFFYYFIRSTGLKVAAGDGMDANTLKDPTEDTETAAEQDANDVIHYMKTILKDLGTSLTSINTMRLSAEYHNMSNSTILKWLFNITEFASDPLIQTLLKYYATIVIFIMCLVVLATGLFMIGRQTIQFTRSFGDLFKALVLALLPVLILFGYVSLCNWCTSKIFNNTFLGWTAIQTEIYNLDEFNSELVSSDFDGDFLRTFNKVGEIEQSIVDFKGYDISDNNKEITIPLKILMHGGDILYADGSKTHIAGIQRGDTQGLTPDNQRDVYDRLMANKDQYGTSLFYYFYDTLRVHTFNYYEAKQDGYTTKEITEDDPYGFNNLELGDVNPSEQYKGYFLNMITDGEFLYGQTYVDKMSEGFDMSKSSTLASLKVQDICGLTELFSSATSSYTAVSYYDTIKTTAWMNALANGKRSIHNNIGNAGSYSYVMPGNYGNTINGEQTPFGDTENPCTIYGSEYYYPEGYYPTLFESALNEVNKSCAEKFLILQDYKDFSNETLMEAAAIIMTLEFNRIMSSRLGTEHKLEPYSYMGESFSLDLVLRSFFLTNFVNIRQSVLSDLMATVENNGGTLAQILIIIATFVAQLAGVLKYFTMILLFVLACVVFLCVYNIARNFFNKAWVGLIFAYSVQLLIHIIFLVCVRALCVHSTAVVQQSILQSFSGSIKTFIFLLLSFAHAAALVFLIFFVGKHSFDLGGQIVADKIRTVTGSIKNFLTNNNTFKNTGDTISNSSETTIDTDNVDINADGDTDLDITEAEVNENSIYEQAKEDANEAAQMKADATETMTETALINSEKYANEVAENTMISNNSNSDIIDEANSQQYSDTSVHNYYGDTSVMQNNISVNTSDLSQKNSNSFVNSTGDVSMDNNSVSQTQSSVASLMDSNYSTDRSIKAEVAKQTINQAKEIAKDSKGNKYDFNNKESLDIALQKYMSNLVAYADESSSQLSYVNDVNSQVSYNNAQGDSIVNSLYAALDGFAEANKSNPEIMDTVKKYTELRDTIWNDSSNTPGNQYTTNNNNNNNNYRSSNQNNILDFDIIDQNIDMSDSNVDDGDGDTTPDQKTPSISESLASLSDISDALSRSQTNIFSSIPTSDENE